MNNPLVIIPSLNSASTLSEVLKGIPKLPVLVIDDGSEDDTAGVAGSLGIMVVSHETNLGVGAATKTGIRYALEHGYGPVISLDSDGQHDPAAVGAFVDRCPEYDLVIGNRFHDLSPVPSAKLAANLLGSMLFKTTFGVFLPDVACGFRAFEPAAELLTIPGDSFDFLFNHLALTLSKTGRIGYVSVPVRYDCRQLLCTRRSELLGALAAVVPYLQLREGILQAAKREIVSLNESVTAKVDFFTQIESAGFSGYYFAPHDAYVIQTDIAEGLSFYRR